MKRERCLRVPLYSLVEKNHQANDFFLSFGMDARKEFHSFSKIMEEQPTSFWDENKLSQKEISELFVDFMKGLDATKMQAKVESLEILAGVDKYGVAENCNLMLKPGEVTCIVGPTGSGKSRLLADIEWLANLDTPTRRSIRINGESANEALLNSFGGKVIAQITQNMNFVLDMDVESFLLLHAQSLFLENADQKVIEVIKLANDLSGEHFSPSTPVTFLSGGQSRALMIADVACIGEAPIVLIDEIENAGVDKKKALELLVKKDKIVLMATHDPLLILLADRRVVIKNGGMERVIYTNEKERELYHQLEALDRSMQSARNFFRLGNELNEMNSPF